MPFSARSKATGAAKKSLSSEKRSALLYPYCKQME